jgi:hypothetical protein
MKYDHEGRSEGRALTQRHEFWRRCMQTEGRKIGASSQYIPSKTLKS